MRRHLRFDPKRRRRPPRKPPKPAKFHRKTKHTWGQAFKETRPYLLLIALVTLWFIFGDAQRYGGPGFLQSEPEVVHASFSPCGPGRSHHCVIDGDTFKIGQRSIRVVGIDTAEKDARCPAEAALAHRSTEALRSWLNRGPFQMTARLDDPTDRYGRDLRTISRVHSDGSREWLADYMIEQGGARRYWGGWKSRWC